MSETRAALLRQRLVELPLHLEKADVHLKAVTLPSYPGEPRPSSTIELFGDGGTGSGENVAWTRPDHERFRSWVENQHWKEGSSLGTFAAELARSPLEAYGRAAIESAAIDLALQQASTNLAELCETAYAEIRYVRSFGATADPLSELHAHQEEAPEIGVKLDFDPAWPARTLASLSALGIIEVLDFKHRGTAAEQSRTAEILFEAWLEDPGVCGEPVSSALADRFSLDAALTDESPESTLHHLNPAAVNLKIPRMGGVLNLLIAAAFCESRKKPFYMGGMFEVSVGREQARELASLLAPQGPNDLAPLPKSEIRRFPPTLEIPQGRHGFGRR